MGTHIIHHVAVIAACYLENAPEYVTRKLICIFCCLHDTATAAQQQLLHTQTSGSAPTKRFGAKNSQASRTQRLMCLHITFNAQSGKLEVPRHDDEHRRRPYGGDVRKHVARHHHRRRAAAAAAALCEMSDLLVTMRFTQLISVRTK